MAQVPLLVTLHRTPILALGCGKQPWKKQVADVSKVSAACGGIEFKDAPEGYVRIHNTNRHLWSKARIGMGQKDGQFKIVAVSPELIEPDPFPKGYQ